MNRTTLLESLPKMMFGEELNHALQILPDYSEDIREESSTVRLIALSDLYQLYVPSAMSTEIYSKLYLALCRSLEKKCSQLSVTQRYENHRAILKQEHRGIMGGADSFTIIGKSGLGKSSAVQRAISLITENRIIETRAPYSKIIPCLIVQCPFDSSVKGLLLEILRKVDEVLGSTYYTAAAKVRSTTDMLIGTVSSVALNHIGLLIVDEIQNVVNSKNGKNLIGSLTQLINNSGISIALVGTPEAGEFFEGAMQLARRSVGLMYTSMNFDDYFIRFCETVFRYQYVREKTELSPAILEWLYEHSAGVVSVVIALIHDAQEIAILSGIERLNLDTLNEAYKQRLTFLHGYIEPDVTKGKQCSKVRKRIELPKEDAIETDKPSIKELVEQAKADEKEVVSLLKEYYPVVEVAI